MKLSIGGKLRHVSSPVEFVVHDIKDDGTAIAIESRALETVELDGWELLTPEGSFVERLTGDRYNSLKIGSLVRKKEEGRAFIIGAIANEVVFVNRFLEICNLQEWEQIKC